MPPMPRAERLRTIADPVRLELFEAIGLAPRGTLLSTADLAKRVPTARRGVQAHLEALHRAGWIELVEGSGRDAVWRRAGPENTAVVSWSESDENVPDPDAALAAIELDRVVTLRRLDRVRKWTRERQDGVWPDAWAAASLSRDYYLLLTPSQLEEIQGKIHALMAEYPRAGDQAPDEVPPGRTVVSLTFLGFPMKHGTGGR